MLRDVARISSVEWFVLSFVSFIAATMMVTSQPSFPTFLEHLKYQVTENALMNALLLLTPLFFAMGIYKACRELHGIFNQEVRRTMQGTSRKKNLP